MREDLESEIKRIVRAYYDDFMSKSNESKIEKSPSTEDAELFSVLDLGKKSEDLEILSQNSAFEANSLEESSEGKKNFLPNQVFY